MNLMLEDKVVIITGSTGICKAVALTFEREGANLAVTAPGTYIGTSYSHKSLTKGIFLYRILISIKLAGDKNNAQRC